MALIKLGLATLGLILLWAALVTAATVEGWGRRPLAPRGDARAFLDAASALVDAQQRGNAVLALLEDGAVFGEHSVSVGDPVDRDTVFQVASLSKWITAWGVLALVEDGRLDLDAPVGRLLTRWKLPESGFDLDGVTPRRLLSHTAGLTDGLGYLGFAPGAPLQTLEQSLTRAADAMPGRSGEVRVGYAPGRGFQYSGGGYTLLQLLIEEVTGEPFEAYMQRTVLQPLGMTRSTFEWTPDRGPRLATFYDGGSQPAPHYRFTALAAASLYTTLSDLTRFLQAQLPGADGAPVGRGVLAPETVRQMWRPQASRLGRAIWGLGVVLYAPNGRGGFVVGHDGMNGPAIYTTARLDPDGGDGIVVLETGTPRLAPQLGGEWVLWKTGETDVVTLVTRAPGALRTFAYGSLAIVAGALVLGWRIRRSR
jgi:CubicO group peptidase (beta-lactamase class C family)